MDRAIVRPDVFLATYQSIIDDDDLVEDRLKTVTVRVVMLLLGMSCLVCALAVGFLS